MTSFSLCMIVKNEEKVLERCLKSLAPYMDEIIIASTGRAMQQKRLLKNILTRSTILNGQETSAMQETLSHQKQQKSISILLMQMNILMQTTKKACTVKADPFAGD